MDWQCRLSGSSKTAPGIFMFSIVLGAQCLSYLKSIETHGRAFLKLIILCEEFLIVYCSKRDNSRRDLSIMILNEGGNAFMGVQAMFSFDVKTVSHVTNWFLQLVFAANAATIVSGSIAERCHFSAYLAYSFIITGNLIFLKCSV